MYKTSLQLVRRKTAAVRHVKLCESPKRSNFASLKAPYCLSFELMTCASNIIGFIKAAQFQLSWRTSLLRVQEFKNFRGILIGYPRMSTDLSRNLPILAGLLLIFIRKVLSKFHLTKIFFSRTFRIYRDFS